MTKLTDKELFAYRQFCNIFIGVDPDSEKSGVTLLYKEERMLSTCSMSFSKLIYYLEQARSIYHDYHFMVVVEGGWLNEGNWHVHGKSMTPAKAAAMGRNVGMNHQTGMLIQQMCESMDIVCDVVKPLTKGWKGKDGKITADELEYFTGYSKRTNQDERDSALLVWNYAGLPIRVKPIGGKD